MQEFAAGPPSVRPPEAFQVDWSRIRRALTTIYDYRSLALHAGAPFPAPMCESPKEIEGMFSEIPLGLATATADAVWTIADTPMLLATFEGLARSALLRWWTAPRT